MTDQTLQRKLHEFVRLGNALDAEAKRRYGRAGLLFHEADGGVHIMDGDNDGTPTERQDHIKFRSHFHAHWGAGVW